MNVAPSGFLGALQLADSFFPSGAYALSHGLETAVEDKRVCTAADVEEWVRAQVNLQIGPGDAAVVAAAWTAARDRQIDCLCAIDRRFGAFRLAREAREASLRMGRRLISTALAIVSDPDDVVLSGYRQAIQDGEAPGHHAVALGIVSQKFFVDQEAAVSIALYTFAVGVLGAALRVGIVDHEQSQAILLRLQPLLVATVKQSLITPWQGMWTGAPEAEICAMRHERATRRSFMT